jgi:membrane-bound metal-dependent hydrolase YbcI (DUF457 family)
MFIGHFALGFAAKRATPRLSLAILFIAAQLADLLWPVFVAVGLEQVRIDPGNTAATPLDFVSYPFSHSLLMLVVWGVLFGLACTRILNQARVVVVIALLVVSHWVLDFVTHRPDMPLYPGGPKHGLGLWNSVPATLALEFVMYAIGLLLYMRCTRARDRIGRWSFYALAVFLAVAYVASLGAAPPSITVLWTSALAGSAILLVWSRWTDRHRQSMVG